MNSSPRPASRLTELLRDKDLTVPIPALNRTMFMPLARVVTTEPRLSYRAEPGVAECCRPGWIGLARRGENGDWLVEVHGNRLKCRVCMEAGQRRYAHDDRRGGVCRLRIIL